MTWRLDANSASGNTRAHTENVFVRWMLSTCVFKSAALAPSLALTQQPLSILFYFVTLDFQSPRAPESLQTPVNSSYKSSRGQMDGGKIMEELSVCLSVCLTLMALLEIWISCSLRIVPSRSMKYEEASWCRASTPWVALTIFRSSLFLAMYMVSASSPKHTHTYRAICSDFSSYAVLHMPTPKISLSQCPDTFKRAENKFCINISWYQHYETCLVLLVELTTHDLVFIFCFYCFVLFSFLNVYFYYMYTHLFDFY